MLRLRASSGSALAKCVLGLVDSEENHEQHGNQTRRGQNTQGNQKEAKRTKLEDAYDTGDPTTAMQAIEMITEGQDGGCQRVSSSLRGLT